MLSLKIVFSVVNVFSLILNKILTSHLKMFESLNKWNRIVTADYFFCPNPKAALKYHKKLWQKNKMNIYVNRFLVSIRKLWVMLLLLEERQNNEKAQVLWWLCEYLLKNSMFLLELYIYSLVTSLSSLNMKIT